MTAPRRCIDCVAEGVKTTRKIATTRAGKPVPGPRCATHHRAKRYDRRTYSHSKHIMALYGLLPEEYDEVYRFQQNRCFICQRATGATKKLSVDHDHKTGMVRGLCCTMCNKYILGWARDDIEFFKRVIEYLEHPPAVAAIGVRIVPDHIDEAA